MHWSYIFLALAHWCMFIFRMHKHNEELLSKSEKSNSSVHGDQGGEGVTRFGFHVPTCCGYIPQDNTWNEDWVVGPCGMGQVSLLSTLFMLNFIFRKHVFTSFLHIQAKQKKNQEHLALPVSWLLMILWCQGLWEKWLSLFKITKIHV